MELTTGIMRYVPVLLLTPARELVLVDKVCCGCCYWVVVMTKVLPGGPAGLRKRQALLYPVDSS